MIKMSQEHYMQRLERMRKMIELKQAGNMPDAVIALEAMVLVSSFDFPLRDKWKLLRMLFRKKCKCVLCANKGGNKNVVG
jgi:hypothetical protein